MYCKFCGNEITNDSVFCAKCGKQVTDPTFEDNNPIEQKETTQPVFGNKTKDIYSSNVCLMTKKEYLRECKKNDRSYKPLEVFHTIFWILWLIPTILWIIRVYQGGLFAFYANIPLLVASFISLMIMSVFSICMIVKNKHHEANYEAYVLNKNKQPLKNNSLPVNNLTWLCDCGNINGSHITYCPNCGNKARVSYNKNPVAGADEWLCPKCGRINKNYVGSCGCGERRPG